MVNRGDDKTRHNRGQGLHYDMTYRTILDTSYTGIFTSLSIYHIHSHTYLNYLYIILSILTTYLYTFYISIHHTFTLIQVLTISYIHYLSPYSSHPRSNLTSLVSH